MMMTLLHDDDECECSSSNNNNNRKKSFNDNVGTVADVDVKVADCIYDKDNSNNTDRHFSYKRKQQKRHCKNLKSLTLRTILISQLLAAVVPVALYCNRVTTVQSYVIKSPRTELSTSARRPVNSSTSPVTRAVSTLAKASANNNESSTKFTAPVEGAAAAAV